MSPGRQNCSQLRTAALNQHAKKGVILLADVIHLDYPGDSGLLLPKGTGRTVWNPEDSLSISYTCAIEEVMENTHTQSRTTEDRILH